MRVGTLGCEGAAPRRVAASLSGVAVAPPRTVAWPRQAAVLAMACLLEAGIRARAWPKQAWAWPEQARAWLHQAGELLRRALDRAVREPLVVGAVIGGSAGLVAVAMALAWPTEEASARAVARAVAAAEEEAEASVVRPAVVRQSRSGHLRVDFSSLRVPARIDPAGGLNLVLAIDADGGSPIEVAVSTYLREGQTPSVPARLARPLELRITAPPGHFRHVASIAVSPCFDRAALGRLTLFIDPISRCRIDPLSIRVEPRPVEVPAAGPGGLPEASEVRAPEPPDPGVAGARGVAGLAS